MEFIFQKSYWKFQKYFQSSVFTKRLPAAGPAFFSFRQKKTGTSFEYV